MDKPLLIFDGDCTFCRYWVDRWKQVTEEKIDYAPYQEAAANFPGVPLTAFQRAVQLILPAGEVLEGAEAVFTALSTVRRHRVWLWMYENLPGFAAVSEAVYRFIASRRPFFSKLTKLFFGTDPRTPSSILTRWTFLRLLGIIYLIAFVSLGAQVIGLIGKDGILPVSDFLRAVALKYGPERFYWLPSVFWISATDAALRTLWMMGAVFAVFLLVGVWPVAALIGAWGCYLSYVSVGRDFFSFQWDALLLETGFIAIFLAPLQFRPNIVRESPPSRFVIWLFRFLIFRLMFMSGMVKLLSGDLSWRQRTALSVHYETQPLPTWLGWYAHHLPLWFQKISVGAVFFIELAIPLFIFAPRALRNAALRALIGFQVLILVTGNYCFFNWLTIALCVVSMDDGVFPRRWAEKIRFQREWNPEIRSPQWSWWFLIPVSSALFVSSLVVFLVRMLVPIPWPNALLRCVNVTQPLHIANSYGLFSVMTTSRPEIVVEGSNDGEVWKTYEFKFRPGSVTARPAFVAPHQPRLDWQMWFAALGNYETNRWFIQFCFRLLQGSPDVLNLLKTNPFPESPPRYIRASVYDYHFTDLETRRRTGEWWKRERKGLYCPVLSLR